MTNYGAKILNVASRSLAAQQAIIANTSNNIANVNTPGYSRRVVSLETASGRSANVGIDVGNGVQISGVRRIADEYLTQLLRTTAGKQTSSELQNDFLGRIDKLFSFTNDKPTISGDINAFFAAVNDLTVSPSSIELRKNVMERANDLVNTISSTFNALAAMQNEADARISTEVQTVNSLTEQIAATNVEIVSIERGSGQTANDARDKRDVLLEELAKKISFQTVEQSDGSVNVYLTNGFTLVSGNKNTVIGTTTSPSFASGSLPPSLSGGVLSYITYDYSGGAGTGDFDLTQMLRNGEGTIGALLKVRGYNDPTNTSAFEADGSIVEVASRIEAITRDLLTRFNETYLGPDEDSGTAGHQASSIDLDGNRPPPFGFFDFAFSGAKDSDGNGRPSQADLAASGIDNFSSILTLAVSGPREIAAARDQNPTGGAYSLVEGDGSNMLALAALQNTATPNTTPFSAGNFSLIGTYDDAYNEMVTHVSGLKGSMNSRATLDTANLNTVQIQRDEIAAVSLDEEFSSLIKFQKAYQASAKMIKVADELLTTILGLL